MSKRSARSTAKPKLKQAGLEPPVVERDDVIVSACRCPYCHTDVALREEPWVSCQGCLARHHTACWREGKACAACGGTTRLVDEARSKRPYLAFLALVLVVLSVVGVSLFSSLGELEQRLDTIRARGAAAEQERQRLEEDAERSREALDAAAAEIERLEQLSREPEGEIDVAGLEFGVGRGEYQEKLDAARAKELQARHRAASLEAQRAQIERERDALEAQLRELETPGSD